MLEHLAESVAFEGKGPQVSGQPYLIFRGIISHWRCSSVTSWVTWNDFKTDDTKQKITFSYFWIKKKRYWVKQKSNTSNV